MASSSQEDRFKYLRDINEKHQRGQKKEADQNLSQMAFYMNQSDIFGQAETESEVGLRKHLELILIENRKFNWNSYKVTHGCEKPLNRFAYPKSFSEETISFLGRINQQITTFIHAIFIQRKKMIDEEFNLWVKSFCKSSSLTTLVFLQDKEETFTKIEYPELIFKAYAFSLQNVSNVKLYVVFANDVIIDFFYFYIVQR